MLLLKLCKPAVLCVSEHLDFMNNVDIKDLKIQPFSQLNYDYIGYQSLTDVPKALAYTEAEFDFSVFTNNGTWDVVEALRSVEGCYGQAYLLSLLQRREGDEYVVDNRTGSPFR